MINCITNFGKTILTVHSPDNAFVFADACAIIAAVYEHACKNGFGEDFRETFTFAVNNGTLWKGKKEEVPPQVQDIIDKTIKGDKDE